MTFEFSLTFIYRLAFLADRTLYEIWQRSELAITLSGAYVLSIVQTYFLALTFSPPVSYSNGAITNHSSTGMVRGDQSPLNPLRLKIYVKPQCLNFYLLPIPFLRQSIMWNTTARMQRSGQISASQVRSELEVTLSGTHVLSNASAELRERKSKGLNGAVANNTEAPRKGNRALGLVSQHRCACITVESLICGFPIWSVKLEKRDYKSVVFRKNLLKFSSKIVPPYHLHTAATSPHSFPLFHEIWSLRSMINSLYAVFKFTIIVGAPYLVSLEVLWKCRGLSAKLNGADSFFWVNTLFLRASVVCAEISGESEMLPPSRGPSTDVAVIQLQHWSQSNFRMGNNSIFSLKWPTNSSLDVEAKNRTKAKEENE